jgi:hypothetical protein
LAAKFAAGALIVFESGRLSVTLRPPYASVIGAGATMTALASVRKLHIIEARF